MKTSTRKFDLVTRRIVDYLRPVVSSDGVRSKTLRLEQLLAEARLIVALDVEHDTTIDGFPSKTQGNGSPGGGKGGVPVSSVEVTAIAREGAHDGDDPIALIVASIEARAERMANDIVGMHSDITRYKRLRAPADLEANQPFCYVAKRLHELPFDAAWEPHKRTSFDGVIDRPWPEPQQVCRFVYDFTRRWRRIPTRDEMLEHLRSGRVMVHDTKAVSA